MKEYKFEAIILKPENINSGFIEFPFDVQKEFGKKGQVKVKAYFDGFEYRGSLVKMGHHCHIIGLNKKVRDSIHKKAGDKVNVLIIEDAEERTVEIPDDLIHELTQNQDAGALFNKLSYTHRKEYVEWITSAKKPETRHSRIITSIESLLKNGSAKQSNLIKLL
jgi:hypothetical protein